MKRLESLALLVTLAASLFGFTGCIMYRSDQLEDVHVPAASFAPLVQHTVDPKFTFELDGGKMITSNRVGRDDNEAILTRWKEEGRIRDFTYAQQAKTVSGTADYLVTLSGSQYGESNVALQVFSGLTLCILPYFVETHYDLVYTLTERSTGRTYRGAASASFTTAVSLLLLPVTPFFLRARGQTYERLADHMYLDLVEAGAFRKPDARRPLASGQPRPPSSYPPVPASPRPLR